MHRATTFNFLFSLVVSALPMMFATATQAQVPNIIIETDMGGDSDDAAMLAFVHRLADLGEINLIAVMHNGNNKWGGAAISAVNTYYNRPYLPIGTYRTAAEANRPEYHPLRDRADPSQGRIPLSYTGATLAGNWVRLLAEGFPCQYKARLDWPDAVDLYREVLQRVPDDTVVIANGGHLGNLSNVFGWFERDSTLRSLFQRKVHRMTGAIGGVNTCFNGVFPRGLSEYVVNNPNFPTAKMSWLGGPIIPIVATQTNPTMATALDVSNPLRESYRYKTEVEQNLRGTNSYWNWHIIDILTSFAMIAWDEMRNPQGQPYFELHSQEWLDVHTNCSSTIRPGFSPGRRWDHQGVGLAAATTATTLQRRSEELRRRFFDDGIYAAPRHAWAPEREHMNLTAMFADGTMDGLEQLGGGPGAGVRRGRYHAPTTLDPNNSGGFLITECGRRYEDLSVVVSVARVPQLDQHPLAGTTDAHVDIFLNVDSRYNSGWGNAPMLRVAHWAGRGNNNSGNTLAEVQFWDTTPNGYRMRHRKVLRTVRSGQPFTVQAWIENGRIDARVNSEAVFPNPMAMYGRAPADGGLLQFNIFSQCPNDAFEVEHILIRPSATASVVPDVHIDKSGTAWFSLVTCGNLERDLFTENGLATQVVNIDFSRRPGGGGALNLVWDDPRPGVLDWSGLIAGMYAEPQGISSGHWVYGLPNVPWLTRDGITLEYRGKREGEQAPMNY